MRAARRARRKRAAEARGGWRGRCGLASARPARARSLSRAHRATAKRTCRPALDERDWGVFLDDGPCEGGGGARARVSGPSVGRVGPRAAPRAPRGRARPSATLASATNLAALALRAEGGGRGGGGGERAREHGARAGAGAAGPRARAPPRARARAPRTPLPPLPEILPPLPDCGWEGRSGWAVSRAGARARTGRNDERETQPATTHATPRRAATESASRGVA